MRAYSGLSLPVEVRCGKRAFREAMIFTHRGLSGPAILQISSYWQEGEAITVNLLPDADAAAFLRERKRARPKAEAKTILSEVLPTRLAQALAAAYLPDGPMGLMTDKALNDAGAILNGWILKPSGTEGYAKAEVTIGGVDTRALSSKTMEAKDVPGLYIIGEAVDVTGWLGGYNFHWAWASGWAAGSAA
jgi:predicted Rossmann fold flavoprotein